jgi:cytochrome oxidase assembly protein ShyY1
LKFLLRPGWIALILLVAVFSALCFTLLAPWQFGRDQETETRNAAIQNSFHAAPQPLEQVLPGQQAPDVRTEWTKVSFHGHYLPRGETLAWLRTVQGEPAIEVLAPFQLDDGQTLLVDRGFLRPVHVTDPPAYPPPPAGPVTLTARVRADETDSDHRPTFPRGGHLWTYAVDSATVGAGTNIPMRPGYFALAENQPGVLNPLPLPQLQTGPYFSYALQWIVFGIMAPAGALYLIYNEIRYPRGQGGRPAPAAGSQPVAAEPPEPRSAEARTDQPQAAKSQAGEPRTSGAKSAAPAPARRPKVRSWRAQKRSVAAAIAEEERREEAERAEQNSGSERSTDEADSTTSPESGRTASNG